MVAVSPSSNKQPSAYRRITIDGKQYPLSKQVLTNIEAIIGFQAKQQQQLPFGERIINRVAAFFGKSSFLYGQIIFFTSWAVINHIAPEVSFLGLPAFDLQEMGIDITALLITTGVLVQQNRQDSLAEQRSHLTLQINLLTEQKIAKLIGLVEELRSDLPQIRDRHDLEAKIMQQATDPQVVLDILQENLEANETAS